VDFRLLGPFEVESDGRDLTPARRKQRLLLAALVLRANDVVAADDLIEALWGASPPATAQKALHGHVSAMRKLLGAEAIETRPPGYVLRTDPAAIDARRFELLLEMARSERGPTRRAELLRGALALFRGEPLADFRYEQFAREEAARLERLRLSALEERIEAELELGRHAQLLPELEQVVGEDPFEERLRAALMLALYRSGRQAQALETYAEGRRRLVDELGIEPGPALQRLERQILNQDSALAPASSAESVQQARPRLPLPATEMIGREPELAEIRGLLEHVRLLTLTGTAGTGKTRLAIAAAAELAERYPGGAAFVALAPVADAELVVPTIAHTFGIRETGAQTLSAALTAALVDAKPIIVVLDNCEHVLDAAPALAQLLAAAPGLTVLATSREPLHLAGERVYAVPPLRTEEAMQLFAERAEAVKPDFQMTPANEPAVAGICLRLDGLPLAIELAAARIPLFPPQALLARLDQRLPLLTSGGRDRPKRHQTLRAAIDWSHDLLPEPHRTLLARFSVFGGGWALEAAEAVCDGDADIVDGLASLIDKNLIQLAGTEHEPRFTMLETIREYAQERFELRDKAEQDALRDRHLAWMVGFAERAAPGLRGAGQRAWLERLQAELDNFRVAFRWSVTGADAELALRLVAALLEFWMVRADWSEGRKWVERALALPGVSDAPVRIKALCAGGELADALSDYPAAISYYEDGLALARALGDRRAIAEALLGLSFEAERVGNYADARPLMQESVDILRDLGDEPSLARSLGGLAWLENDYRQARRLWSDTLAIRRRLANQESVGWTLIQLGYCAQCEGDYAAAHAAYDESLSIARELGYERMIARCLTQLGEVAVLEGDPAAARRPFDESLPTWREIGHRSGLVDALRGLGDAARLDGDFAAAASFLEECHAVSVEIGARPLEARALQSLAALANAEEDIEHAESLLRQALALWREIDDIAGAADSTRGLGEVAATRGDHDRAARLLAASEALRERVGAAIAPVERGIYQRAVDAARTGLGEAEFATSWAAGRDLEPPAIDELAVGLPAPH
jgi:predicted ATPase/DNA-binding SARP family transcriptional activator